MRQSFPLKFCPDYGSRNFPLDGSVSKIEAHSNFPSRSRESLREDFCYA
jgi:hypothetical protein